MERQAFSYSSGDCLVSLGHGHQVTQHRLCLDEAQSDVGGRDPVLQHVVGEKGLGRRPVLGQRDKHLAVLDRQHFGEFRGANHLNGVEVTSPRLRRGDNCYHWVLPDHRSQSPRLRGCRNTSGIRRHSRRSTATVAKSFRDLWISPEPRLRDVASWPWSPPRKPPGKWANGLMNKCAQLRVQMKIPDRPSYLKELLEVDLQRDSIVLQPPRNRR